MLRDFYNIKSLPHLPILLKTIVCDVDVPPAEVILIALPSLC